MVKISVSINYNGVGIIITILILYWLFKIDKCLCTHIPEGKYLKEWFIFDIIFSIIFFGYFLMTNNLNSNYTNVLLFVAIIITIINIIMIIRLSTLENFIYYWYIVGFSFILFMILFALLYYLFINK